MFKAKVLITLRSSILDPQGKAVENSLKSIGFDKIVDTRIGKFIELTINETSPEAAHRIAEDACKKLLANSVMEDFEISVEELNSEMHSE